ncbi:NGP1NT-domain-containing [Pyrrhoderma noxium]|uniref:Nucleolar GTP-binding protein 2 n=1 Tax=Pyrrhoderma noxium TaxID=2282107 RepID=A0A286USR9_9AGAM|nr:NGP1NT-domain-containing [Pyrrhoderma noxium]
MAGNKKVGASPKARSSSSKDIIGKKVKGENFYRDAKKVGRIKMLNSGKPVYDRDGKIKEAAAFQTTEKDTAPGRVQPDRRWFGNTRVISQTALDHFRTSLTTRVHDPYSVLLRRNKLPMALLDEAANPHAQKRAHIVETEPFGDTFGPKAQRKKPRLNVGSFEELGQSSSAAVEAAEREAEAAEVEPAATVKTEEPMPQTHANYIEPIYFKGTSRRIYGELYKVIDSSDVILHILDARDPFGTMCESVLDFIRREKAHKQVVLIINKCDLVPNWVTARYIQYLTPRYPTLAFHASPNHSFGKGSLIQLLRQFSQLHSDKKQISVGFVGYPNVGKSSVINTLKSGKVCKVAPIPGETKVWQYITLTRRIYLIDCPGIVPASAKDSLTSTVLKGVVRVEALPTPSDHIPALMTRVKPVYLSRTYGVPLPDPEDASKFWEAEVFLDKLARTKGRLLKGGEPDLEGVARIVLSDWVRGRIPFFVPPPERPEELNEQEEKKRRRAKAKEFVPAVTQKLRGIIQKNTFVNEDIKPLEEEEGGDNDEDGEAEDAETSAWSGFGDDPSGVQDEEGEEDEGNDEIAWGDVFAEDGLNKADADGEASGASEPEEDEDEESPEQEAVSGSEEDDPRRKRNAKEPRMTTNKRKATNFFTNANVKNKNRNRQKPKPPSDVRKKSKKR